MGQRFLSVDIGNTSSKFGLFSEQEEPEYFRDISAEDVSSLLSRSSGPIFISKTGSNPELENQLKASGRSHYLNYRVKLPISLDYETPETLGSDRIAAACGANHMYPGKNILVLDSGTCITLDLLDSNAVFRGGIISPGVEMRFRAMHEFTAALPYVKFNPDVTFPGKSSIASMQVGVYQSIINELQGYFNSQAKQFDDLIIVDCSRERFRFDKVSNYKIFAQPKLVLFGLYVIAKHNA
ncbi:type III pantothenate kinase [bacterium]|nr:type III pantothenate kinase [bacterium]